MGEGGYEAQVLADAMCIGLSEKYMGPHWLKLKIQLYILKFHVSYGTGPLGLSEPYMGPHISKLRIQLYILKSNVSYGTGPIGLLEPYIGPVP